MSNLSVQNEKSKVATALFAFFLGGFGVHRFYLNQTGRGLLYLLLFWSGIPFIIAFVDFIVFISMDDDQFDRKYNPQMFERRNLTRGRKDWNIKLPPPDQSNTGFRQQGNNPQDKLLQEVSEIRNDIIQRIQSSKEFKSGVVSEIKPLVDNYIGQVRELISRDQQVKQVIDNHSLSEIDEKIFELNSKMNSTNSDELREEYKHSLNRYIHHKNSLKEFYEQREMIALRLDSTLMSLREVKFDLVRLQNLNSDEQRRGFFKLFDEKTSDLSLYLNTLRDTYQENRID